MGKNTWWLKLFQIGILLFLLLGFYWPVVSFLTGDDPFQKGRKILQWSYFLEFFQDSWNLNILWFSVYQAFLSTVLSLLVGLPGAWVFSHYQFPGKKILRSLLLLPFILPSILVVLAMILFFGNQGVINRLFMEIFSLSEPPFQFLYSLQGILVAHVFYNFPIVVKTVGDSWERLTPNYWTASRCLGKNPVFTFLKVTFPLLRSAILSSCILIFLLCLNSFAIILVLGGIRYTTIEVLIYQLARIELDYQGAASLSLLQVLLSFFILNRMFRKANEEIGQNILPRKELFREIKHGSKRALAGLGWLIFMIFFGVGPLVGIVLDSFQVTLRGERIWSFQSYFLLFGGQSFVTFFQSVKNSLLIAFSSACCASVIGFGMVGMIAGTKGILRKFLEGFSLFPIALSSVVFGVAWFNTFQNIAQREWNLFLIVISVHSVLTYPYWIRIVLPAYENIPKEWSFVASTMGVQKFRYTIRVILPWLKRSLLTGFAFSFSLSLGEINSTLMIADENLNTLPLEIYRAISGYRFTYASAVGTVLLLLCGVSFFLLQPLGKD